MSQEVCHFRTKRRQGVGSPVKPVEAQPFNLSSSSVTALFLPLTFWQFVTALVGTHKYTPCFSDWN